MTSAKRQEAQSPARPGGVADMDDPITAQITREVAGWDGVTDIAHVIALFRLNYEKRWAEK
jgi:hypothetical protein